VDIARYRIIQVCAISLVDERTVRRFLRGERVRDSSRKRIVAAARELGIELGIELPPEIDRGTPGGGR
jgi:hypothetical protein